jgi:hypothetical protein
MLVPRCGAPLIWVPTTNTIRSGRTAWTLGRIMSTDRSRALASTLLGDSGRGGASGGIGYSCVTE